MLINYKVEPNSNVIAKTTNEIVGTKLKLSSAKNLPKL